MILPEIGHHFLQLSLARHRPRYTRRLELGDNLSGEIELPGELPAGHGAVLPAHHARRVSSIATHFASRALLLSVLSKQIVLILPERRIPGDELLDRRVVDLFGAKLSLDPVFETDGADLLHVARRWPEGQTVQRLNYLLVCREITDIRPRDGCLLREYDNGRDAEQGDYNRNHFCDSHETA
jgi:hypothetical protein